MPQLPPSLPRLSIESTTSGPAAALQSTATAFVANTGQWDAACQFRAQFGAVRCDVHTDGWSVAVPSDKSRGVAGVGLRFRVVRTGPTPTLVGETKLGGRRNYFLGDDPTRWCADVPAYASVLLQEIAPGIDLRLRQSEGRLKYDVLVDKSADPGELSFTVEGATALAIDATGALLTEAQAEVFRQPPPVATSGTSAIACRFRVIGRDGFGFSVDGWDRTAELVIDPPLLCSTYLGGTGSDVILSVAESTGPLLTVCGLTNGDFPVTLNGFDRTYGGSGGLPDAFIAQLDLSRTGPEQLVYSTYLGGPGADGAQSVMVDAGGVITMVGGGGPGFPTTANAYRQTIIGRANFCVVRLDPARVGAAQLLYSTFIGDDTQDLIFDAALDRFGRVAFVGYTNSTLLPVTEGAIGPAHNPRGGHDGYIICLDPALPPARQVVYCTYVGGEFDDQVRSVVAASDGTWAICGYTDSRDLRTTEGAYQRALASSLSWDAFVWILDPSRVKDEQLVYGTYLGGVDLERAFGVALDVDGTVTVVGTTTSPDFPTTPNAFSRVIVPSQGSDGFITRFDPRQRGAAQLVYSTFFGGRSGGDGIAGVVARSGLVTVAGGTYANDLPTSAGSFSRTIAGDLDFFIAQLDTVRSRLIYGTYIGGARSDGFWDLMLNEEGVATVAGSTVSFDYPATPNAYQRAYAAGGLSDACLTQLELQADGLVRFGRGTKGCTGPVLLRGTAMPQMGNVGFSILCTNAPPLSAGALLVADRRLQSSFVFAGAELWIDPRAATVLALSSSDLLRSDTSMPIPARTDLIGIKLFAQAVWVGPSSPLPCPPLGLSTSFGLEITVQP